MHKFEYFIGNSHFASTMLDKFQRELSTLGYSFTMHRLQDAEIKNLRMPAAYNKEKTAGIRQDREDRTDTWHSGSPYTAQKRTGNASFFL